VHFLSDAQIAKFKCDGFVYPIYVFSRNDAANFAARFRSALAEYGDKLIPVLKSKPHLVLQFANEMVHNPVVLDAVESVIGPDFLAWSSDFFDKAPDSRTFISWHQDSTYMGLSPTECVTAWIALSPSTPQRGNVQCIPGSHTKGQRPHVDTGDPENMLSRGQSVALSEEELNSAENMVLEPGQMSIHHCLTLHASMPNYSENHRLGFAIRFIPTIVRQIYVEEDGAMLVRGKDTFGHFRPDPEPRGNMTEDAVRYWREQNDKLVKVFFRPVAEESEKHRPSMRCPL
jgi:hypothetical protein